MLFIVSSNICIIGAMKVTALWLAVLSRAALSPQQARAVVRHWRPEGRGVLRAVRIIVVLALGYMALGVVAVRVPMEWSSWLALSMPLVAAGVIAVSMRRRVDR